MSSILDLITGGGLLPHVYCKKATLERNAQDSSNTDVTLLLELYQDKNALLNSSWLNDLSVDGANLLDALFIQVLPFKNYENVMKLRPSYAPNGSSPANEISIWENYTGTKPSLFPGNIYLGKNVFGDNYLPRGEFSKIVANTTPGSGKAIAPSEYTAIGTTTTVYGDPVDTDGDGVMDVFPVTVTGLERVFTSEFPVPDPIQISNSSLLGNITGADLLSSPGKQIFAREEIINGKPYYIIPFEYKYTGFNETVDGNLGFAFYTFLHTPYWIDQMGFSSMLSSAFFEEFVVEGPINTEIVFVNGETQQTREAFFLPEGRAWEGAVHLHAANVNPDPSGYEGDGLLSGPDIPYRGWMAGDKHIADAPKLRLLEVPNDKIADIRHGIFPEPLDEALGLGTQTEILNLSEAASNIEAFTSAFQKEKKKDFVKDSDSEFSKLYICRDKNNNARGMFSINARELLKNNSNLYSSLHPLIVIGTPHLAEDITSIIQKSKILQLKVYRDRVKKHVINTRYENYANDEPYEEPSKLIGILSDTSGWMTPNQNDKLAEVDGLPSPFYEHIRYFMFTDTEVGKKSAGLYQYRVVLEWHDGTHEYLYDLYKQLSQVKADLDSYYDLSVSSFSEDSAEMSSFSAALVTEEYRKRTLKKYYQNGVFVPGFLTKAVDMVSTNILDVVEMTNWITARENGIPEALNPTHPAPWVRAPALLQRVQNVFKLFPRTNGQALQFTKNQSILNMIDPVSGSPKGIGYFSRLVSTAMNKLGSLINSPTTNKAGSNITKSSKSNGYTFESMLDITVSPSNSTIMEEHSFDHPNELFEAVGNENIYSDYLSIGTDLFSSYQGLRSLKTEYFINRCRLEAAKLSPIAKTEDGFNGLGDNVGKISKPGVFGAPETLEIPDSLSHTGYSYLAPSIVRLADPIKKTAGYNFHYSCFKPGAISYLDNPDASETDLYSPIFTDWSNYDKVFMSLLNYSIKKTDSTHADLTDALYNSTTLKKTNSEKIMETVLRLREPYKRTFEEVGMTFHDVAGHNVFFEKESGAVSIDIPDKDEFPLSSNDFSDGITFPLNFFKDFLSSGGQTLVHFKKFTPTPRSLYQLHLPNSFKIHEAQASQKLHKNKLILQPAIQTAFDNALDNKYNTFFFFQINLTAKVEVYRGTHGNSKNDEGSWTLLTQDDLNLSDDEKLFCRLSLFDETLNRKIILPILDKYFLIYNNATSQIDPLNPLGAAFLAAADADTQTVMQYDSEGTIIGVTTVTATY